MNDNKDYFELSKKYKELDLENYRLRGRLKDVEVVGTVIVIILLVISAAATIGNIINHASGKPSETLEEKYEALKDDYDDLKRQYESLKEEYTFYSDFCDELLGYIHNLEKEYPNIYKEITKGNLD